MKSLHVLVEVDEETILRRRVLGPKERGVGECGNNKSRDNGGYFHEVSRQNAGSTLERQVLAVGVFARSDLWKYRRPGLECGTRHSR